MIFFAVRNSCLVETRMQFVLCSTVSYSVSACIVIYYICNFGWTRTRLVIPYFNFPDIGALILFKRKTEEQKPKEHRPKANENKPVMTEWWGEDASTSFDGVYRSLDGHLVL